MAGQRIANRSGPEEVDQRIRANRGLAFHVIHKHFRSLVSRLGMDDVESAALVALGRASELFDATQGYCFSTYAARCIRNQLLTLARQTQSTKPEVQTFADAAVYPANPCEQADTHAARVKLADWALQIVPDREREILQRRAAGDTLQEIGLALGLTRERVRQIEERAIRLIRDDIGFAVRLRRYQELCD